MGSGGVARYQPVMVLNRERPVYAIVHPDEVSPSGARRRGRLVREVTAALAGCALPDSHFAGDIEAVLRSVGPTPESPWER